MPISNRSFVPDVRDERILQMIADDPVRLRKAPTLLTITSTAYCEVVNADKSAMLNFWNSLESFCGNGKGEQGRKQPKSGEFDLRETFCGLVAQT